MSWPLSHEFNEAVQNPQVVFSDPDLKGGETVVGATGLPLPRSGNFADVYQVRGADGREWAVKCFTRPVVGLAERYAKLNETLDRADLSFTIGFTYLAEGIRVGGVWRPVVKMEWVEGLLLNQVARKYAGKPKMLTLGQMWTKLCKKLREAGIAHADIQHGNVLLVPGSRARAYGLKLIDYDGMWVPALANTPSGESGHPSYQHPARAATRTYSPDVDRFPHLAVATALRGLWVGGRALWEKYDNGDNLLFTEGDYKQPNKSKLMKELWHAGDPAVQSLVGRLAIACGKPIPQTPWLDHLAPEGEPAPLDDTTRREAAAALGISLPVPGISLPAPAALPPEPVYTAEPEPAPEQPPPEPEPEPEPELKPEPARAPVFEAVLIAADDRDERRRPAKKSKKPKKREDDEDAPKKNQVLLFAGAGLLLLVGGIVAGVLIAGGKSKPPETVQQKADDPTAPRDKPADPVSPRPKPPDPVVPPKDNLPDPVVPAPMVPDPVVPAPPMPAVGAKLEVRAGWEYALPADFTRPQPTLTCSADSGLAVVVFKSVAVVLDTATGKPVPGAPKTVAAPTLRPLGGGRFAVTPERDGDTFPVVDFRTGRQTIVTGSAMPKDVVCYRFVSPDLRYVAVGQSYPGKGPHPFKFGAVGRKPLLEFDWMPGYVHFTADSTRVLVAEASGRSQWFKLPSGERENEWTLEPAKGAANLLPFAASADGSILLYRGQLEGRPGNCHVIDGRTGRVIRSLGAYGALWGAMSADGSLAVLPKRRVDGKFQSADVVRLAGGEVVAELSAPLGSVYIQMDILPNGSGAVAIAEPEVGPSKLVRYEFTGGAVAVKPPDPAPGAVAELKQRWSVDVAGKFSNGYPFFDDEGQTLLVTEGVDGNAVAFNARTGAPLSELKAARKGNFTRIFPLDGGKFGFHTDAEKDLLVWDTANGKTTRKPLPQPVGATRPPMLNVSSNGQYVAVSHARTNPKPNEPYPESPFQVVDTTTGRPVLSFNWPPGTTVFSPDSSRILVVDATDRFRWYKLPTGGKPEFEWKFGREGSRFSTRFLSVSADGGTILYYGKPPDKESGHHLLDGKTGEVLHSFPANRYLSSRGAVSADGRFVALIRTEGFGHTVEVLDTRGTLLGSTKNAQGKSRTIANASWKAGAVVVYDRDTQKLTAYDLPEAPAP